MWKGQDWRWVWGGRGGGSGGREGRVGGLEGPLCEILKNVTGVLNTSKMLKTFFLTLQKQR